MIKEILKSFISKIEFWIIIFFIFRMIGITNPPLETAHNWRQTTVTMVARNFCEIDNNIFYPRMDIAGDKTGITGMEFPILNYLIYLVSLIFNYQHWYGRLINLIVSSFGILFFYKLIKKYFTPQLAFNSAMVLLGSLWFVYSRKIMPDTFAASLMFISIYYGSNYLDLEKNKIINLLLYALFALIGILSKLPLGYLLVVFIILFLNKDIRLQKKVILCLITGIIAIPIGIWYFYWTPYLVQKYGFWHFFMGKNIVIGAKELIQFLPDTLKNFYQEAIKFIGFAVYIWGLIMAIKNREKILISIFILCSIGFLGIMLKSGYTFSHHVYYIIPFVPIMSLLAGYGLTQIKYKKIYIILLFAIIAENILNQTQDFRIKNNQAALLNLENDLNKVSKPTDLIIINSGDYPTSMYFSHRKGWVANNDQISNSNYISELKTHNLKQIVILKKVFNSEVILNYPILLNNEDYCIYSVSN